MNKESKNNQRLLLLPDNGMGLKGFKAGSISGVVASLFIVISLCLGVTSGIFLGIGMIIIMLIGLIPLFLSLKDE